MTTTQERWAGKEQGQRPHPLQKTEPQRVGHPERSYRIKAAPLARLRWEEPGVGGSAAEGAVKGDEGELGGGGESTKVGVGPVFGGGAAEAGEAAENAFEARRLVEESNAIVLEPAIVGLPGLRLIHDFIGHDRFRGEEAEKAELGKATEKEARVRGDTGKP